MSRLRYTSAAWDDLTEIMEYIAADNLAAADRWVEKIQHRCKLIAQNP
jgi:plasmid stabilization system protein ParE